MVSKQTAGVEASAKNKPLPKNQSWMDEFDSDSSPEEMSDRHENGEENFAELFEASQKQQEIKEGEVVDGTVISVNPDFVTVDIGYKCEGLVPIQEFRDAQGAVQVASGDVISVYLERMEMD